MGPFCAIDFETTGSVQGYPVEPWQVGVARVGEDGRITLWESLLRVGPRPFHPQAPGRHEALRAEIAAAPTLTDCLDALREHCAGLPLVGHNVATEKKCLRDAVPMESFGPWIDTLTLTRAVLPALPSYSLENVTRSLGLVDQVAALVAGRAPHDALYDAAASAVLLRHFLGQAGWEDIGLEPLLRPDTSAWRDR